LECLFSSGEWTHTVTIKICEQDTSAALATSGRLVRHCIAIRQARQSYEKAHIAVVCHALVQTDLYFASLIVDDNVVALIMSAVINKLVLITYIFYPHPYLLGGHLCG
jgi:hypothetical protein